MHILVHSLALLHSADANSTLTHMLFREQFILHNTEVDYILHGKENCYHNNI